MGAEYEQNNFTIADEIVKEIKKGDIDDLIFFDQTNKTCSEK